MAIHLFARDRLYDRGVVPERSVQRTMGNKFLRKIAQGIQSAVERKRISPAIRILAQYQGLVSSMNVGRPVAADGSPLPWYTYPAIEYLRQFDATDLKVFEFGCGNSSLFWARKGAHVWCVEHDPQWHAAMSVESSALQGIALREGKEDYAAAIFEPGILFDLIIIDGRWRNESTVSALECIRPAGFFIVDNSDWYVETAGLLRDKGFFQVDFNGFGPINNYCWTTSLFLPWKSSFSKRFGPPQPIGGIRVARHEKW